MNTLYMLLAYVPVSIVVGTICGKSIRASLR